MIDGFIKYLSHEKRLSHHTITSYKNDLIQFQDFLRLTFEIEDLKSATNTQIRSWIVHLSDNGIVATSINRKLATLKSFYKFLVFRGLLDKNPSSRLMSLKQEKKLPEFVKEEDITRLLDQLEFEDNFEGLRDQLLLELLYATGIRLAELINLRDADINVYDKTVKVLGKRNKERILPVHNSLISLLGKYQKQKKMEGFYDTHLLLTSSGKKVYPMFIYRKVREYLSMVTTISKKSPHVIRHSFATHLLNKGAELNAVKDLLGHSSLAATQVYTHNSIEKLKKAFEQAHPKA